AVEADQDPKVTGAHVGGCYIVVHLEPPAGVSQIPSDGDNPASKAPSSGSIIAMFLHYVELCAVDSSLVGPGGDDQHGRPRLVQHTPTGRTQQPAGQTAATAVPHHDECCAACGVKKHVRCRAFDKLEASDQSAAALGDRLCHFVQVVCVCPVVSVGRGPV